MICNIYGVQNNYHSFMTAEVFTPVVFSSIYYCFSFFVCVCVCVVCVCVCVCVCVVIVVVKAELLLMPERHIH